MSARRRLLLGSLAAFALAACGDASSRTAPDQPVLAFDEAAAVAANGELPAAEPRAVCGADDRRFLAELIQGNPLQYKVPKRLADVKAPPSAVQVSGVAARVELATVDFPFDHTFGIDLNLDVSLDEPFAAAAQSRGVVGGDLHVELAAGQYPHEASDPGPASGESWEEMARRSAELIMAGFVPEVGSRVLVMGSWIVDCGHLNFQTELHPITFLASAREQADATVVHAFYNPYRETQLYNPDPATALAFDDPARFADPATGPFPKSLIDSILRIQDLAPEPYRSIDHLESWAMLEPNRTSPVAWRACAPPGSSGRRLDVRHHFVARPGVEVAVLPDEPSSCATVAITLGSSAAAAPAPRSCATPWDFLNEVAAEEAGVPGLDLKQELGALVAPQFKSRLDPAPVLNCYDPLAGPAIEQRPAGQRIDVRDDVLMPFYGVVSVRRSDDGSE